MFDFLFDQNFLSALAAMIGPLAFFAAPTEEIEHMLFHEDKACTDALETTPGMAQLDGKLAEAA